MVRRLFLALTTLFWLGVAGFAWFDGRQAPTEGGQARPAGQVSTAPPGPLPGSRLRAIDVAELARHARPADCWMAIDGQVYDLSAYLPRHPSEPEVIEPWCGREATEAYRTQLRGRAHSARADRLLEPLRIGQLR